jgi:transposase-like protein
MVVGLTAAGRARRETVRLAAAAMYEDDMKPVHVAHELRVSTKSAYQWRRRWRADGTAGPAPRERAVRGTSYLLHQTGYARRSPCTVPPSATRPRSRPGGM